MNTKARSSTDSAANLLSSAATTPQTSRSASIAPSISSVLSEATTITAPEYVQRGFKSRESYLAALQEFAESKSYMEENEHTLVGWYGTKTMDDYKQRMSLREERRKRKELERRVGQRDRERRSTLAETSGSDERLESVGAVNTEGDEVDELSRVETKKSQKEGTMRRLSRVFTGGRRATVA